MKVEDVVIYLPFGIYDNVFCITPYILGGICVNSGSLSGKNAITHLPCVIKWKKI